MTSILRGDRVRREAIILLGICVAFGISAGFAVGRGAPFEYDESVYAVQARAWADPGAPVTGVRLHRAPMLPAIGGLAYRAGARGEAPYRAASVALGLGAVVLVWALGRAIAGPAPALVAAAAFASAPMLMQRSAQFMTDVPASAFLLGLALVFWRNRERAGRSLLLLAPLAAGAFYLRYASALPIVLLVLVAVALWHRSLFENRRVASATALLFAGLLVPHIVRAIDATGKPWGLLTFTASFPQQSSFGEGLWDYVRWFPVSLAGPVAALVMAAGLLAAASKRSRRGAFLVLPAIGTIVLLGLTQHAEPRFVFFPVALLCVAGGIAVCEIVRDRRVLAAVLAGAMAAGGVSVAGRQVTDERVRASLAGKAIAARAATPCTVLSVEVPVMTWYSGCATYSFDETPPPDPGFIVLFEGSGRLVKAQPAEPPAGFAASIAIRRQGRLIATVYVLAGS